MSERIYARIAGTGSYLPEKVLSNEELARTVETSDEWIRERTGITQRHIAADEQTTGDLAYEAALRALEAAGIGVDELDMIIVGTTTPDLIFPSTACLIQARLGASGSAAFDVNAACSGFIFALSVADKFIRSGDAKHILVIGAETLTRIVDWTDRTTCVLFGDGAAQQLAGAGEVLLADVLVQRTGAHALRQRRALSCVGLCRAVEEVHGDALGCFAWLRRFVHRVSGAAFAR